MQQWTESTPATFNTSIQIYTFITSLYSQSVNTLQTGVKVQTQLQDPNTFQITVYKQLSNQRVFNVKFVVICYNSLQFLSDGFAYY